jgi:hypothetical protein
MTIDETFNEGVDLRTPIEVKDHQVPFRFTEKLKQAYHYCNQYVANFLQTPMESHSGTFCIDAELTVIFCKRLKIKV